MSVKRITIRLTDVEYECLKQEAEREHRTVAQQAAYRVTKGDAVVVRPYGPYVPLIGEPVPPWRQWISQTDTGSGGISIDNTPTGGKGIHD